MKYELKTCVRRQGIGSGVSKELITPGYRQLQGEKPTCQSEAFQLSGGKPTRQPEVFQLSGRKPTRQPEVFQLSGRKPTRQPEVFQLSEGKPVKPVNAETVTLSEEMTGEVIL